MMRITARGLAGDTSYFDGAGGGGAGGVILLDIDTIYAPTNQTALSLNVDAGDGADANGADTACHGPGGGGGGGYIGLSGVEDWETVDLSIAPSMLGGNAGTAVDCTEVADDTYGAQAGTAGRRSYQIKLSGYFEN